MFSASYSVRVHAEGVAEGRAAERARILEILGAPQARGRALAAAALAFETDAPAAEAVAALAAAPVEGKP